ncbi:MAG: AMP-binding protein [Gammaproteobacteria bacterium]
MTPAAAVDTPAGVAWQPSARHLAESGVARLVRALGVDDYDALLDMATTDPARYWQTVCAFCDIAWDVAPSGYVDLAGGREFPRWFPGGRLNWVNTVLAWGERAATADGIAIASEDERGAVESVTYSELGPRVRRFAAALGALGVEAGDRVGLFMENGLDATVALLAIAYRGAVAVPLFSGFGAEAVVARLGAAEARVLLAAPSFERRGRAVELEGIVREAWTQLPALERVVWKGGPAAVRGARELAWDAFLAAGAGAAAAPASVDPDHPFLLIYTSGTTGKPKGIVHVHGGFPLKIAHDAVVHLDIGPGDAFSWPADIGWIAGTLVASCALLRGAKLVCYTGAPDVPDFSRMARLIERHRVTHYGAAPTLIRSLASHEAEALAGDRSSIRLLMTAGEGIDPEHFGWFQRHFGAGTAPLVNYTGGTEVSGALLASVVVRPIVASAFNSTSPGVAVDVVGPDGAPLTDAVGELAVRAPFVGMTRSFWRDDERYLETYWQTVPGLWIHGDLALRRGDGQLFLRGRSDDTLKVAGKRLGPAEVEEAVLRVEGVVEAAAIGVADPAKGERLVVFVTASAGIAAAGDALAARVTDAVAAALGRAFRPAAVHVVTQLPKTRSGKILRRVVRNLYAGLPPGDLSSLDDPAALDEVRRAAAHVTQIPAQSQGSKP